MTFVGTLANPYPNGVLAPIAASKGADTFLGQGIGRIVPLNFRNGQNARYLVGIQRELPGQWLLDVGYTGSRGFDITTDLDLNPTPAQYLSTSRVRDQRRWTSSTLSGESIRGPDTRNRFHTAITRASC